MNILVLGNLSDSQTMIYVMESFKGYATEIHGVDIRRIVKEKGVLDGQRIILDSIKGIKKDMDLIIVLKGTELVPETLKELKSTFKKAKIINWFFDKYLIDKPIWESESYYETIKLYDYYFCSLKGVADKLLEKGFSNVRWLPEACSLKYHKEAYSNNFQKKKYGSDVSFVGSIGYMLHHPNRIPLLSRVVSEGFDIKIYGDVVCDMKHITLLKNKHSGLAVINEHHSLVAENSLINIGIDQDPSLDKSYSARIYRVMCAGGLYLCTATKGLDEVFKINKKDEEITSVLDLVVFYDEDDLIEKLDFLLENEEIRKKIALNGQKKVKENHTFEHRAKEILEVLKNG